MLVADLHHFLDMPHDASEPARRLAQHLGDIIRAGTAGEVGDPWVSALPCRRRPAHRRCPGRMTIAIVCAEASAPIRWWCSVCDDEGVISTGLTPHTTSASPPRMVRRPDATQQATTSKSPGHEHSEAGSPQEAAISRGSGLPNRFVNS
ncbi:hypothetical protein [Mycobacterium lacus]|uniref:hypothetical protein n=1 Tax=Mycobacterium lacus TaxID=169765 RepID=UPI0021F37F00|nr:hypothetical protein [Mycobacterium lacus]